MALQDIVTVNITTAPGAITRPGYGVPLILSATAPWAERVREYTDAAGVAVDFPAGSAERLMADRVFAQNPRPPRLLIGRRVAPTQRFRITISTVADNTGYSVRVGADTATFTSGAGATAGAIATGLAAAIEALPGTANWVAAAAGADVTVTASAPGVFVPLEAKTRHLLTVTQDHADPGVAADLDAILAENNTWYALLNPFNSRAEVLAIAAWAEANEKFYLAQVVDSDVPRAGAGDVVSALNAATYFRTLAMWHPASDAFADAALAGAVLPYTPGAETWAYKALAGVPAVSLTGTEESQLSTKRATYYSDLGGNNLTQGGKVAGNEWADVIRGRDWLRTEMQAEVFGVLSEGPKLPYTDKGAAVVQGAVLAVLQRGVDNGLLADSPRPLVTVPAVSTVASADKAARRLPNVNWTATLAGAIQAVTVTGTVSV